MDLNPASHNPPPDHWGTEEKEESQTKRERERTQSAEESVNGKVGRETGKKNNNN